MRTANATYPFMVAQLVQPWQADAGAQAPAGEAPAGEAPAGEQQVQVPAGETTGQGEAPPTPQTFDDAFSSFSAGLEPKTPEAAPATEAKVPEPQGLLPQVGADGKPIEPQTGQGAPAGETPEQKTAREAAEASAAAAEAAADAAKTAQQQAPNQTSELVDALRKLTEERQAKQPDPQQPQQPQQPSLDYTPEQRELVDNFEREWPDIAKASEIIRARELAAVTRYIFSELAPVLQQITGRTNEVAAVTHEQQLAQLVPDYNTVAPKVVEWIGKQPDFLKAAYENVARGGNAQQVATMIDRWRTETGAPKPAAIPAPTLKAPAQAPAPAPAPAQAPKVQKPPASLAPVKTLRGGVPGAEVAPDDFDGAFERAAKEQRVA